MAISQITAVNAQAPAFFLGDSGTGTANQRTWFINGVAYTSNAGVVAYCTANPGAYQVTTVGSIPALYTTQVARLESWPGGIQQGSPIADAEDPNSIYAWPQRKGADAALPKVADVRQVLAGTAP